MNLVTTIQKIAGNRLQDVGFLADKQYADTDSWRFSRQVGDVVQYITFEKSINSPRSIRVHFSTSNDFFGVYSSYFVKEKEFEEWWYYEDQESLNNVVSELVDIIMQHGLAWFGRQDNPAIELEDIVAKKVLENPYETALAFAKLYELDFSNPQSLQKAEDVLRTEGNKNEDVIIGVSSFYGEFTRSKLGGNWAWDEELSTPCITNFERNQYLKEYPCRGYWMSCQTLIKALRMAIILLKR